MISWLLEWTEQILLEIGWYNDHVTRPNEKLGQFCKTGVSSF